MQTRNTLAQRPLFAEWPTWRQLPEEVRQRVEHLLVTMCLEAVTLYNDTTDRDQCDEHND